MAKPEEEVEAVADDGAQIQKVQKKIRKLTKQRDAGELGAEEAEAAIAKATKRLAKLEAAAEAVEAVAEPAVEESAAGGKKGKKRQTEAAAAAAVVAVAAAEADPAPKKAKKSGSTGTVVPQGPAENASVGSKELAAAGKPVVKALYKECKEVLEMSAEKVASVLAEREMTVSGSSLKPLLKFEHTGLSKEMLHACRTFTTPSPIQSQCWPIIMAGHDLIGIAATGSGKTLAFGLPAIRHIAAQKEAGVVKGKGPFALAMAPTRELACQIADVLTEAGSQCGIKCVCVYGGVPKYEQIKALRAGVEIVVGTPGRLEDLMTDSSCGNKRPVRAARPFAKAGCLPHKCLALGSLIPECMPAAAHLTHQQQPSHRRARLSLHPQNLVPAGLAHTFFSAVSDKARAGELINVLKEAGQNVPQDLLNFGTTTKKKESKLYGAHFKDVDFSAKSTKMTFGDDDE
ncbi:MAG: hypothetical protein WDW38_009140 [Sanguina aurantia]